MKYCLFILTLCVLLSACDKHYNDTNTVFVLDTTARDQYFTECVHSIKDFDTIALSDYAMTSLKNACREAGYNKNLIRTTYGEYKKHANWQLL